MGNGEREDENRKLAEWLEPIHTFSLAGMDRESPRGAWSGKQRIVAGRWEYSWYPKDFRTDEAANAMLLEKMPCGRVYWDTVDKRWHCEPDWRFFHNGANDSDRKTAVYLAALALLNERGRG